MINGATELNGDSARDFTQKVKWDAHISTGMYSFLGFSEFEGTLQEAIDLYYAIALETLPKPVNQMEEKAFREIEELVYQGKPIADDPGIMDTMSPVQQNIIKRINNTRKRLTK